MKIFYESFAFFLTALLLSGCASSRWAHDSLGDQEFQKDNAACLAQAGKTSSRDGYGLSRSVGLGTSVDNDEFERCMKGRGWYEIDDG